MRVRLDPSAEALRQVASLEQFAARELNQGDPLTEFLVEIGRALRAGVSVTIWSSEPDDFGEPATAD